MRGPQIATDCSRMSKFWTSFLTANWNMKNLNFPPSAAPLSKLCIKCNKYIYIYIEEKEEAAAIEKREEK